MRRLTVCSVFVALASTVISSPLAGQKSTDRKYVEFCVTHMSPEMRREVAAMRCVLTPAEFDILLGLDYDGDRERWIKDYWEYRDPVYTTPENEILTEHLRRVAYADSAFRIAKWPMWDDRGEVYIRYGAPTIRNIIRPELDQYRELFPGEMWLYGELNMTVVFEDPFSRGVYKYYIERVQGPLSVRMRNIGDPIDGPVRGWADELANVPPTTLAMEQVYNEHLEGIGNFYEMMVKRPSAYPHEFARHQEPFVFSVDNFRGGRWIDRVDVNIEFEADLTWSPGGGRTRSYVATAVFWDTKGDETQRREHRLDLSTVQGAAPANWLIPAQLVFSLPPGFYTMGVTVEEVGSARISSYRADVTCVDLESKLALSDILFASAVRPADRESPFNRGALEVVPHASRAYPLAAPIPVYFEVYNLARDALDVSSYTVEYRVGPHRLKEPGLWDALRGKKETASPPDISSSFRMSGNGPHDAVHITLAPENLRAGCFDLHVKITDELSGAEATRVAAFRINE